MKNFDIKVHFENYLTQGPTDIEKLNDLDKKIDKLFSLDQDMHIEATLSKSDDSNLYIENLDPQALNTSYIDFYLILTELSKKYGEFSICDLGSAYGRMVNLCENLFPAIRVTSVEPVKERLINTAMRLAKSKHTFFFDYFEKVVNQITSEVIFLYFPTGVVLNSILKAIKNSPHIREIVVIESHGELINRLKIESSWLMEQRLVKLQYPRHNPYCYIFRKIKKESQISLTELEKLNNYLLELPHGCEVRLSDGSDDWLARLDKECIHYDEPSSICIEFNSPPRSAKLSSVDQIKQYAPASDTDELEKKLIKLRNAAKPSPALPRKIYPSKKLVELADGRILSYAQALLGD